MTTILPSALPIQTAQTAGVVVPPLAVVSNNAGAAIADLIAGSILEASVVSNNGAGQVTLTTGQSLPLTVLAKGLAAELLTPGAQVAVQIITNADGQISLRLLSVDAQTVARPLVLAPPPATATLTPGTSGAPGNTALVLPQNQSTGNAQTPIEGTAAPTVSTAPQGLVATILRPSVSPTPTFSPTTIPASVTASQNGGLPSDLPTGTTISVRILSVATPAEVPSPTPLADQTGALEAQTLLPAKDLTLSTPVDEPPPESSSLKTDLPFNPPLGPDTPKLAGTVISAVPGQKVLVTTPIGLISLPPVTALKAAATVTFDVVSPPQLPLPEEDPFLPSDPFTVLNDSLSTLTAAGETTLLDKVMSLLPQLDTRLAATLSMMMKNISTRSENDWSEGEVLDDEDIAGLTKSMGKNSAQKTLAALKDLTSKAALSMSADGEWRGFTLPLATGPTIDPISFFIRQPPPQQEAIDPDGQNNKTGGIAKNRDQRFLVELNLSRLGRFQMDGLVQRSEKRFDLIVRTHTPLSREMKNDITDIFITTTEAAGSTGSVTFQSGGRFITVLQNLDHTKLSI